MQQGAAEQAGEAEVAEDAATTAGVTDSSHMDDSTHVESVADAAVADNPSDVVRPSLPLANPLC